MFWIVALLIGLLAATIAYVSSKPSPAPPPVPPTPPEPILVLLNFGAQTLEPLSSGAAFVNTTELPSFPDNYGAITFDVTNLTNPSFPNIACVEVRTTNYDWAAQEGRYQWLVNSQLPASIVRATTDGITRTRINLAAPPVSNSLTIQLLAFSGTPLTVPLSGTNIVGVSLLNYVS